MSPTPTHIDVLGVHVSAVNIAGAADTVEQWIENNTPNYVCVTGVHGISESQDDPELLAIHNRAGLVVPDGMPLVWCGHRVGANDMSRVYGPDLMLELCKRAEEAGHTFFFYGGAEGTPEKLHEELLKKFPKLNVVGTYSPPFRAVTAQEDADICAMISESGADVVWIGLSTPKQERWMDSHIGRINATMLGVGAAFDFHAGNVSQAPPQLQRAGLEWAYRLFKEPRRLWRRYLTNNPKFVVRILRRPPQGVHLEDPENVEQGAET